MEKRIKLKNCLVVISGRPLSGKNYTCDRLVKSFDLKYIDVDEIRNEIDEIRKKEGKIVLLEEKMEANIIEKAYIELCKRAKLEIIFGKSVLISGTFSRDELKKPLRNLINYVCESHIPFKVFLLTVDDENVVAERIKKRVSMGSLSNIDDMDKYHWAKGFFQKIDFTPVMEIDTTLDNYMEKINKEISSFLLKKGLKSS